MFLSNVWQTEADAMENQNPWNEAAASPFLFIPDRWSSAQWTVRSLLRDLKALAYQQGAHDQVF